MATLLNGVELKDYDQFLEMLESLKREIATQEGFPNSSNLPDTMTERYQKTSDEEKRWMFHELLSQFELALRHWKVEKDALYPKKNPYPKDDIRHYMKQGWEKFWY